VQLILSEVPPRSRLAAQLAETLAPALEPSSDHRRCFPLKEVRSRNARESGSCSYKLSGSRAEKTRQLCARLPDVM
jgi:hypothetical protein